VTSIKRANHSNIILGAVCFLLVLCLAGVVGVYGREISDSRTAANRAAKLAQDQQADIECVAAWANASNARSARISKLNDAFIEATDNLIRSIQTHDQTKFNKAYIAYLAASNKLANAKKTDPIPPSPEFRCAEGRHPAQPSPAVTVTATPPPPLSTRSVTASATRTVGVPRPGPTVTVTAAGPVVTRTQTRTATRTRTVTATVTRHRCPIQILC
jgi:hypothetical protein